ncbi:MAG: hypothetical protein HN353_09465 [Bdellovibrionales bacterium]|nr:hypothetical protein [Bdellovibrionales bacterium]MBT3525630.1 hypothetical protein [Bdellovibrionales bacterium]MBT7668371.1 hypothetical protein [Bdellovibrionales bacterium]MBT7767306.1 hypothetical protein [Bdellovibrionales bacterium]
MASSLNDLNSLFPGESIFFYWKTSSTLWRDKLSAGIKGERVIIPINWALHTVNGNEHDFAQKKPESDLKKLVDIIRELGKEVVFFLPLTPLPFLPNGGVPPFLASYQAWCSDQLHYSIMDQEERVHHFYSYFDPKVYRAFHKFIQAFADYLQQEKLGCDIWGIIGGSIDENGEFQDYLFDRSPTFNQGFGRFLQVQREEEMGEESGESEAVVIDSPGKERYYQNEFHTLIATMYLDSARELLAANWEGVLPVAFIGGDQRDLFSRISGRDSVADHLRAALSAVSLDVLPLSTLIAGEMGDSILETFFNNLVSRSFLPNKLMQSSYLEQQGNIFAPLFFANLYRPRIFQGEGGDNHFRRIGLQTLLEQRFTNCFQQLAVEPDLPNGSFAGQEGEQQERELIHFFSARHLSLKGLKRVLQLFMQGGRVVLDRAEIDPVLQKRLDSFIIENSLTVSDVNFHILVSEVRLGDSKMVLLDSSQLVAKYRDGKGDHPESELPSKVVQFWEKIIATFEIQHISLDPPAGVLFFWHTRSANSQELNFHEIRRLNLYNASSYKRKVVIGGMEKFALLKVLDEVRSELHTGRKEITVELLPWGSLAIDFGLYL